VAAWEKFRLHAKRGGATHGGQTLFSRSLIFLLTKARPVSILAWKTVLPDERALRMPSRKESDLRLSWRLTKTPNNQKSPTGRWPAKEKFKFFTFEAGMYMKTKEITTKCPRKNRTF
jgi:hypothetical protein